MKTKTAAVAILSLVFASGLFAAPKKTMTCSLTDQKISKCCCKKQDDGKLYCTLAKKTIETCCCKPAAKPSTPPMAAGQASSCCSK
jgi:hypothetical protein